MAKNDSTPEKKPNKATKSMEFNPEEFKSLTESFEANPKEHCSIICGNNVLFLGDGVVEITITKAK